jgi:hypothetical protein
MVQSVVTADSRQTVVTRAIVDLIFVITTFTIYVYTLYTQKW